MSCLFYEIITFCQLEPIFQSCTYHLYLIRLHFLVSKVPYLVSFIALSPFVNQSLFSSLTLITFIQLISLHFLVSKVSYPVSFIAISPFVNQPIFQSLSQYSSPLSVSIFSSLKFHILSFSLFSRFSLLALLASSASLAFLDSFSSLACVAHKASLVLFFVGLGVMFNSCQVRFYPVKQTSFAQGLLSNCLKAKGHGCMYSRSECFPFNSKSIHLVCVSSSPLCSVSPKQL